MQFSRGRSALLLGGFVAGLLLLLRSGVPVPGDSAGAPPESRYVGASACAQCHAQQWQAWTGSQHQKAMQSARADSVRAPFQGERVTSHGVRSEFRQRNGHYYVWTDGPDGKLQEFEVTHTLGISPLQQYLVPMANGGMQALTLAWDTRPKDQGGQRWFDLQAHGAPTAGDELHWTGRQNNWNFMCAECHTTQFKKKFDPQSRRYASTWSEMGVSCEACHGPGSRHIDWAAEPEASRKADQTRGLALQLQEGRQAQWTLLPDGSHAQRSAPPSSQRLEAQLCARCHSHRSQISDNYVHGKPLEDTHLPSLLEPHLFWPDGQMKAEVYNYASFLQSRMYQQGVTCSNCHDPHTQKLRAPGNQVCLQCHAQNRFETPSHHRHAPGSPGAACAACHMPTVTYMAIDARHDHSIRVPRPDLSQRMGTPNACNRCHSQQSTQWATDWSSRWYPRLKDRPAPLDAALRASDQGEAHAVTKLLALIRDPQLPGMARASALARATPELDAAQLDTVRTLSKDPDPLIRQTAAQTLAGFPMDLRLPGLLPLLADPVRAVRMAAARGLTGAPTQDWSAQQQAQWRAALAEYIAVQGFNADRPEAYNNLGTLYADLQDWPQAEAALQQAIDIAPELPLSALNLADVYRQQGREAQAQALLQDTIQKHPGNATARYALGLSLLRGQQGRAALAALREATQREPDNQRFAYVYAVALREQGFTQESIAVLGRMMKTHPQNQEIRNALQSYCQGTRHKACAP